MLLTGSRLEVSVANTYESIGVRHDCPCPRPRRRLRDDAQRARPRSGGPICGPRLPKSQRVRPRWTRGEPAVLGRLLPCTARSDGHHGGSGDLRRPRRRPLRLPRDPRRRIHGDSGHRPHGRDAIDRHLARGGRDVRRALGRTEYLAVASADGRAWRGRRRGRSMIDVVRVAALIAVLSTGVVYGTDVFCALVQRPALSRVDDRALTTVMGNVHRYGDRRMPIPGALGIIAAATCAAVARIAGRGGEAIPAATAVGLLLAWIALFRNVSAPINRQLAAAAEGGEVPANVRVLQRNWDRIITTRAVLQGLAVAALCITLLI